MAKTDPNLLTQAEYARSRKRRGLSGGSRESVRKAVDEKRISSFGPGKLVDQALADVQWERNTRTRISPSQGAGTDVGATPGAPVQPELIAGDDPPGGAGQSASNQAADPNYMQFRARREQADASMAEMKEAEMRGMMLRRDDVDRAMYEIGRELRDGLTACAHRIASEVASLVSAEACEAVISREHRIVLELLVTSLREKVGAPARMST